MFCLCSFDIGVSFFPSSIVKHLSHHHLPLLFFYLWFPSLPPPFSETILMILSLYWMDALLLLLRYLSVASGSSAFPSWKCTANPRRYHLSLHQFFPAAAATTVSVYIETPNKTAAFSSRFHKWRSYLDFHWILIQIQKNCFNPNDSISIHHF